jgi:hypothetical protein
MTDVQENKLNPILTRFLEYLDSKKIAPRKAEEMLHVGNGRLGKMKANGTEIKRSFMENILQTFPDLTEQFLSQGKNVEIGAPRLEARPTRLYADPLDHIDNKQKFIHLPDGSIAMRVPIVPARAYAGYMRGFADPEYYDDLDDILIGVDGEANGTYIGFEVIGDSMVCLDSIELADESVFPGRIAIGRDLPSELWKTRLHTHNYRNWVFVHKTEGILIKQIANHDIENGIVTIHSLNPKYPDEDLRLEDMQQIFSVIQVVQRTRPKLK